MKSEVESALLEDLVSRSKQLQSDLKIAKNIVKTLEKKLRAIDYQIMCSTQYFVSYPKDPGELSGLKKFAQSIDDQIASEAYAFFATEKSKANGST
jgi:uncharacterized protein with PhoU and TrkA domain